MDYWETWMFGVLAIISGGAVGMIVILKRELEDLRILVSFEAANARAEQDLQLKFRRRTEELLADICHRVYMPLVASGGRNTCNSPEGWVDDGRVCKRIPADWKWIEREKE